MADNIIQFPVSKRAAPARRSLNGTNATAWDNDALDVLADSVAESIQGGRTREEAIARLVANGVDVDLAGKAVRRYAYRVDSDLDRDDAIKRIRAALRERSGKSWSVKGGRGTSWGWITITAPPRRRDGSRMTEEDARELGALLDLPTDTPAAVRNLATNGVSIPAAWDYRAEHVARAEGREPLVTGKPYWD